MHFYFCNKCKINAANDSNLTLGQVAFSQAKVNTNSNLGSGDTLMRVKAQSGNNKGSFLVNYDRINLASL